MDNTNKRNFFILHSPKSTNNVFGFKVFIQATTKFLQKII